jgi:hypothetical protein
MEQNVSVFLLTNQVSLVKRIRLHFDRFHTFELDSKFGELFNLVRIVSQKYELRVNVQNLENVLHISILSIVMLHAEHFVGLKGVDISELFIILDVHASPAFTNIAASPSFLNEIKENSITSTYFPDCTM